MSEVQTITTSITTSASDLNEIQYIIVKSEYAGNGLINEVQEVQCDATGGEFVVGVLDDFVFICHDANEKEIKDTIESMDTIDSVQISFASGFSAACAEGGGRFNVTFEFLHGLGGY